MVCWVISAAVARGGDGLAGEVFLEAGKCLGAHVKALVPRAEEPLLQTSGGLHIVAVGSVLTHCWDLIRDGEPPLPPARQPPSSLSHSLSLSLSLMLTPAGFLSVVQESVEELTLVSLSVSSAVGGAVRGAEAANLKLPMDYQTTTKPLYHYRISQDEQQ